MDVLRAKLTAIREKRLHAISAFYGKTETLLSEHAEDRQFAQRVRTFSQDAAGDILYALNIISTIRDAAIVVHGAAGCAVSRFVTDLSEVDEVKWAITNLNERDSIMGSDAKLREAVIQINKLHQPKIIFIVSTPVVAINNDDIESVVEELKDELGIAIIPIYSDGFRSKIGTTGYDLVSHSIIKQLLPPQGTEKLGFANLISVSEKADDIKELHWLLNEIGLKTNIFPRYTALANIRNAKKASFSIAINPDEANYPGTALENRFQIPYIQSVLPIGIGNTAKWLTEIAIATGRETEARELIAKEKARLLESLGKNRTVRKKAFVSLPPAQAIAITGLLEELGFDYVGLRLAYIDEQHIDFLNKLQETRPDFQLLIGDGQLFEEENVIRKLEPDLYIGNGGDFAVAIRNGIPVVNLENVSILGFSGAANFAEKTRKVLLNSSFTELLSQRETKSYTKEWLKKSTNWFIKQEVK
ncbi:MAG: nitrogenase component 1 [Bacteroidota bacterium]|nr:nitrogenase component 1 [Bacteroidota bacterium]